MDVEKRDAGRKGELSLGVFHECKRCLFICISVLPVPRLPNATKQNSSVYIFTNGNFQRAYTYSRTYDVQILRVNGNCVINVARK